MAITIRTAQVLPGTEIPAGDGLTGALRCTLILPDGTQRAAILKRAPLGEVAAEAFAALLLRAWGLPVPEPFIVDEPEAPAFASADAGYPNLKQRLGLPHMPDCERRQRAELVGCRIATTLPTSALAAAADEAIDNRDRNLGNILWDGASEDWIDHAYALGQRAMADVNKLCAMATAARPSCAPAAPGRRTSGARCSSGHSRPGMRQPAAARRHPRTPSRARDLEHTANAIA